MRCDRCDHDNLDDARFCANCGRSITHLHQFETDPHAPLGVTSIGIPLSDTPSPQPGIGAATEPIGASVASAPPVAPAVATRAGSPGRSALPYVVTAVVLAGLVVAGIAFVTSRSGGEDSEPSREQVTERDAPADTADSDDRGVSTTTADATGPAVVDTTIPPTSAPESSTTPETSTTPDTPTTTDTPTTAAPATTQPPVEDPSVVAFRALATHIDADRPRVDGLLETWVPQISAKQLGTFWEGVDYGYVDILQLHEGFRSQYDALLVSGAEYNFKIDGQPMVGWYISIVNEPYTTADGALSWCIAARIDADNCAAKLITNRQDAGATLVGQ